MFDFGWWELGIVGLIMILVLGPKELPHAMRSIARFMRKARRLASEFQGHVDDLIREADLDEVKQTVRSIKNQDVNKLITDQVDPGGELAKEINDTMADAEREMKEIKTTAGPRPGAPTPLPVSETETDSDKDKEKETGVAPALENAAPSSAESESPSTKTADAPPAAAGPA